MQKPKIKLQIVIFLEFLVVLTVSFFVGYTLKDYSVLASLFTEPATFPISNILLIIGYLAQSTGREHPPGPLDKMCVYVLGYQNFIS